MTAGGSTLPPNPNPSGPPVDYQGIFDAFVGNGVEDPEQIDFKNPDYAEILLKRGMLLDELRKKPDDLEALKHHYAEAPWDFVNDWGMTFDPRNLRLGRISTIPFVLFKKQRDFLKWVHESWLKGEQGLCEKSRDMGVTWLVVGYLVCMFLFRDGFVGGVGSRKEELVDNSMDEKAIFFRLRFFLNHLPAEFRGAWNEKKNSAHMRIFNPDNGSSIVGEAGKEIGRGGRTSLYFVDEAAFIEQQDRADSALSQNTTCQIDVSTVNGNGNAFYKKKLRFEKSRRYFVFDWRDDPRKDIVWYEKECERLDAVVVAREIDRDYDASVEDAFIPSNWVSAAVDAHSLLGFDHSGIRVTGFDPADKGDAKACINRWGSIVTEADQISRGDITIALPWSFHMAQKHNADILAFDADGMGAPAMKTYMMNSSSMRMGVVEYHGSASVEDPDFLVGERRIRRRGEEGRTNAETYRNFRAQSWTWVRDRFEKTYNAVEAARAGKIVHADPEELISLDSHIKELDQLKSELSRPKREFSQNGKIIVEEKAKMRSRGVSSPNLADALIIAFAQKRVEKAKPRLRVIEHSISDSAVAY